MSKTTKGLMIIGFVISWLGFVVIVIILASGIGSLRAQLHGLQTQVDNMPYFQMNIEKDLYNKIGQLEVEVEQNTLWIDIANDILLKSERPFK